MAKVKVTKIRRGIRKKRSMVPEPTIIVKDVATGQEHPFFGDVEVTIFEEEQEDENQ